MLPKTLDELNQVREECYNMVTVRAIVSGTTSVIPIPGADIAADVGMLLHLIPAINKRFGLSKEQISQLDPQTRTIILRLIKAIGAEIIGKVITERIILEVLTRVGLRFAVGEVVKYIPVIGQITSATLSFCAMKYVGNSHVDDCYEVVRKLLEEKSIRR